MAGKKKPKKPAKRSKPRKRPERRVKLRVIPESETEGRSVFVYTGEGTVVMQGPGNVVMECGSCGSPLVVGIPIPNIQSIVFRCKKCGSFNESLA